jgi:hypothetical protein
MKKGQVLYIVATVVHTGESSLFGDIILVTPDKKHARTIAYTVKEKRPVEGVDYKKLVAFDDVMYFERKLETIDLSNVSLMDNGQ